MVKGEGELTAFVIPYGQYEYLDRTPFGLKGAGDSFQRFMSKILGESNFVEALCYLDDILVWGRTWEEHKDRLRNSGSLFGVRGWQIPIRGAVGGIPGDNS